MSTPSPHPATGQPPPAPRRRRSIHLPTLASFIVAGGLIAVGVLRSLALWSGSPVQGWILSTPLRVLAYKPENLVHTYVFKVLATPSVAAAQYGVFRILNRSSRAPGYPAGKTVWRRVDFRSPWLRLLLTTVVSAHWVVLEAVKFSNPDRFQPFVSVERPAWNLGAILLGQLLAFWGMKYLSFEPLWRDGPRDAARRPDGP